MFTPTILVVEDNLAVRQMLGIALREFGFAAHLAKDGQEAIAIYQREAIDLVLMDVRMPVMDGPTTLLNLRFINPKIVCCFMSADMGHYTPEYLHQVGAAAVVDKPCPLEKLRQVLLRLLGSVQTGTDAGTRRPESNRRAFPRRPTKTEVKVTCTHDALHEQKNLASAVIDISEGGVRLLLTDPLPIGQKVCVRLDGPSPLHPVARAGRVVWSSSTAAAAYVGVHLESHMASAEVLQLT